MFWVEHHDVAGKTLPCFPKNIMMFFLLLIGKLPF